MKNKTVELLSFLYIVFFIVLMFNSVIKTAYSSISLETYSKYIYISGAVGLLIYISSKIKNFKFNKYEIFVFIMMILSCLSLLNAVDINVAIFGRLKRHEGLLVWLSYYILFLNSMNIKNKKYLYIIVFLISMYALSNTILGLYQVDVLSKPASLSYLRVVDFAAGFLGNSNFFGSLSCLFYGLVLGFFINAKMGWKKYLLAILLLMANLCVIINGAMSAIVGIIVINFVCLIQIIISFVKKRDNRLVSLGSYVVGIVSFILVFSIYSINHATIKNDVFTLFSQAKSVVVDQDLNDDYGTGRIYIWKHTIEKMKEAPITGYGIDNYADAFDYKLIDQYNCVVDKAHNDYLQKAFCEGIISAMVFVVFLLMIFFSGVFKQLSPIHYGLFLAFVGYSVQAFFNISFINVAPMYFIISGMLTGVLIKKNKDNLIKEKV